MVSLKGVPSRYLSLSLIDGEGCLELRGDGVPHRLLRVVRSLTVWNRPFPIKACSLR